MSRHDAITCGRMRSSSKLLVTLAMLASVLAFGGMHAGAQADTPTTDETTTTEAGDDDTSTTDDTTAPDETAPTDPGDDENTTTTDDTTTTEATTVPESSTTLDPFPDPVDISSLSVPSRPGTTFQTRPLPPPPTTTTTLPDPTLLPANSGTGRRAVYSKSAQRVWAVDANGTVLKTHRVSGKLTWCDPRVGTYEVWSRSRHTYSINNPTIKWGYMVRFTKGCNGGNIGFHEIPFQYGQPVQTIAQLGQPLSGGCVRQALPDAIWMWNWAQLGTKVVVLP